MRKAVLALLAAVFTIGAMGSFDAEAKRLGGAKSSGMQRQNMNTPPANSPAGTPGTPAQTVAPAAATAAAAAPAAAATAKRSWMGPVAGLAAGLGIAALASHFGFGEALANMLTMALVAMAVIAVIGFILRKRAQSAAGGLAPAYGGAAGGAQMQRPMLRQSGSLIGSGLAGGASAAAASSASFPADFDAAAFERNAKQQFMALQAANDAGDADRLRDFLTPEMLEIAREDLRLRDGTPQSTEVFGLSAQVLDVTTEADRYVVSVRFTGSVRTEAGAVPDTLDEIWHLTKPREGMGGWLIAGIQQVGAD
jgi:predicted lipid-binding transport protein (Tim44 family)